MKRLFVSISILFMFLNFTLSYGHDFQGDDYVLILVTGICNACASWGVSGNASMYVYSPTGTSNSNYTPFVFVPVAENIPLESRSAKKVDPIDEFDQIKSFWIFYAPPHTRILSLRTKGSMLPYTHIPIHQEDPSKIRKALLKSIPEKKQSFTIIDTLERLLHI